jgi:hypothetical protein
MTTLHTFGCSITQGFALPDTVKPLTDIDFQQLGRPFHWTDVHLLKPSDYAWPQVLARKLGIPVENYARRGACVQQIARQCAVAAPLIKPGDLVIVMWTYLSRISLQWPARTAVPLCNIVDSKSGWHTRILPGFNKLFGLTPSNKTTPTTDQKIQDYIRDSTQYTYLDPLGVYNQYYNSLVLLSMTDGFLRATGARVLHLSVEPESYLLQLESARIQLYPSLREPYNIPDPQSWYTVPVDHNSCRVIHDPLIPPAENDMHPSITHHDNFAHHIYTQYFETESEPTVEQHVN